MLALKAAKTVIIGIKVFFLREGILADRIVRHGRRNIKQLGFFSGEVVEYFRASIRNFFYLADT